jgi:hypothetical protein
MRFTDEEIAKLQGIWRAEFDETISVDEARAAASRLVELVVLLLEQVDSNNQ